MISSGDNYGIMAGRKRDCKIEIEYPILEIWDLGDRWVYVFCAGSPAAPGIPMVTISKTEGKVGYITIPPLENIGILDEGKLIYQRG